MLGPEVRAHVINIAQTQVGSTLQLIITIDHVIVELVRSHSDKLEQLKKKLAQDHNIDDIQLLFTVRKKVLEPKFSNKQHIIKQGKVIMVASGKGGVGKSSIAVLLALYLQRKGKRVGLLDADVYGPSIPQIFDIHEKPRSQNKMLLPIERHGIKLMSFGFLLEQGSAAIWRGPMIHKALTQLLIGTEWGELDYLIIDTPPGTGDIHISLLEKYAIDAAFVVSTCNALAIADVRKSLNMFAITGLPVLALISNMDYMEVNGKNVPLFGVTDYESCEVDKVIRLPFLPSIAQKAKLLAYTAALPQIQNEMRELGSLI